MRNASVHALPAHHVGSFSSIPPLCPALLSWQVEITFISEEKIHQLHQQTVYKKKKKNVNI